MADASDQLLTVAEVARYLGVTPHTVYRWISQGRLPATRYSPKVIRVRRTDLTAFDRPTPAGVAETRAAYQPGPSSEEAEHEAQKKEIKRLLGYYSKLSRKPRPKGAPRKGSPQALLEVAGILTKDEGEELRRIIKEAKDEQPRGGAGLPGAPPKGSKEALLQHLGVINEREGKEMLRAILKARISALPDDPCWTIS